ncbi:MAG: S9 family peptidase [Chloroflexota bacterium]|nr:MAG: S9 family peptidase [Chloroflexota bacterium]
MTATGTAVRFDLPRFVSVRRAYGPSFSPRGDRIAFVSDMTGVPQIYAVSPRGGWPEQLTFTTERVGLVAFSPTDERMVVGGDIGGDERVQLSIVSPHGESTVAITTDLTAMNTFGDWSPDGRFVAYASNARDPRHFDIFVHDVASGVAREALRGDGAYAVEAWSPDGSCLIVSLSHGTMENDLYELEIASGSRRHLTPRSGPARFESVAYARDGRFVYLLSDRDSENLTVSRLDLASLELTTIVDIGWDIESIALSADGGSLAYLANVDGFSEIYVRDLTRRRDRQIPLPAGVVARGFVGNWRDGLRWSPDGGTLAFSFTSARDTQNVWLAEVATGRVWPLTNATQAGIPSEQLSSTRLVSYSTFDERKIPAFLYVPDGARPDGKRPAIVLIHGGPESQIRPGFDPVVQYFVHRGFVVLTPNVRGSTGYGKTYCHLDDVERRMDAVADARAAVAWLASEGWAARDRIAAMGQSYGGFMVLACLATGPDVWAAGVDLYGIANFVSFLENTHPFRRHLREAEYGSLAHHRDVLERISPLNHVQRIVAPLLAIHGEKDPRVPIGETEQIVAALQARGVPAEFVRLPDEGHGIVKQANRLVVYPAIADFLERYLRA